MDHCVLIPRICRKSRIYTTTVSKQTVQLITWNYWDVHLCFATTLRLSFLFVLEVSDSGCMNNLKHCSFAQAPSYIWWNPRLATMSWKRLQTTLITEINQHVWRMVQAVYFWILILVHKLILWLTAALYRYLKEVTDSSRSLLSCRQYYRIGHIFRLMLCWGGGFWMSALQLGKASGLDGVSSHRFKTQLEVLLLLLLYLSSNYQRNGRLR